MVAWRLAVGHWVGKADRVAGYQCIPERVLAIS